MEFETKSPDLTLRAGVSKAKNATEILELLITALGREFPDVAQQLSLNSHTNEQVTSLRQLFKDLDRTTLPRRIIDIVEAKEKEEQAIELYQNLKAKISDFTNKVSVITDPLERENLIKGLMKNCVEIIDAAFPSISHEISNKTTPEAPVVKSPTITPRPF